MAHILIFAIFLARVSISRGALWIWIPFGKKILTLVSWWSLEYACEYLALVGVFVENRKFYVHVSQSVVSSALREMSSLFNLLLLLLFLPPNKTFPYQHINKLLVQLYRQNPTLILLLHSKSQHFETPNTSLPRYHKRLRNAHVPNLLYIYLGKHTSPIQHISSFHPETQNTNLRMKSQPILIIRIFSFV